MKIKLFGKELFQVSKPSAIIIGKALEKTAESKVLPDFQDLGHGGGVALWIDNSHEQLEELRNKVKKLKKKKSKTKPQKPVTPKGIYDLKMLDDVTFELNTNEKYVNQQLETFKDKLDLVKGSNNDVRRGVDEVSSILIRMENRKKYNKKVNEFYGQFPYTLSSLISKTVSTHSHLKLGKIDQFVADLPKEAIEIMKDYNFATKELCDKQAVFYIIADKKDFKQTDTRRDPILLAQSPFGHFWQILGAWDDEMLFLEEL